MFRTATFAKPSVLAIALCSVTPADSDTGALTNLELANSGAYTRQTLNPLDANWADVTAGNGTTSNQSAITYSTATTNWGTVVAVAICDSATYGAGNCLFYGSLSSSKVVSSGDVFQFAANQLSCQIDN